MWSNEPKTRTTATEKTTGAHLEGDPRRMSGSARSAALWKSERAAWRRCSHESCQKHAYTSSEGGAMPRSCSTSPRLYCAASMLRGGGARKSQNKIWRFRILSVFLQREAEQDRLQVVQDRQILQNDAQAEIPSNDEEIVHL